MEYIQHAADRNDIMGLYFMALYEETEGNFDHSTSSDLQKLSNAIDYPERARGLIEANPHYPRGRGTTIVSEEIQRKTPISLVIFSKINHLYQMVYVRKLETDRESKNVAHKDTLGLLTDLENSTKKCPAFPFQKPRVVSYWYHKEKAIQFRDVNCGVDGDFARKVRHLEKERLAVASNSQPVDKLKNCEEYIVIENKKRTDLNRSCDCN